MRYKAWGDVRFTNGSTPTKYTYTGQYSNVADFGLMYYNARWYDPTIAHFAQADSIVPEGVQGYDRYAYVSNNPIRYNDPSGHKADCGTGFDGCANPTTAVKPKQPPVLTHNRGSGDEEGGGAMLHIQVPRVPTDETTGTPTLVVGTPQPTTVPPAPSTSTPPWDAHAYDTLYDQASNGGPLYNINAGCEVLSCDQIDPDPAGLFTNPMNPPSIEGVWIGAGGGIFSPKHWMLK